MKSPTGRIAHTMPPAMDFTNAKGKTLHAELPDELPDEDKDKSLLTADYSELERRVMAHYAVEDGVPMPGAKLKMAKAPDEPAYRRFECMDGPLAGRGLIVPMPASRVAGYNLYHTEAGAHVAYHADLLA